MTIKALVFDFDGLILETEMPAYQSWADIYREHGVELPRERWYDYIGRESRFMDVHAHLEELTGRTLDRDATRTKRNLRRDELLATELIVEGVDRLFHEAKGRGMKLGIASSSPQEWVCGHLERLAFIDGWDAIVCRADVQHAKPAPDLYLKATELLGVAPRDAVALEDSPIGIEAAKAAGLRCVAVPNALTNGLDLSRADVSLPSLARVSLDDLLARVDRPAD